jgi:hypothetical protein
MDFALCTYRAGKTTQPRLALSLRQRGDHHTLLFSDGSYVSTWSARVHPLNFLDALPIVDRIALLDESLSTFPVLVRLVTGAALGRPGVRVQVGCDTLHPTRGLMLGVGWSGSYDMVEREFTDVATAVAHTTDALHAAAAKASAKLKVYFSVQSTLGHFDGAGYVKPLRDAGYLRAEVK